jgi:hypothetical protein
MKALERFPLVQDKGETVLRHQMLFSTYFVLLLVLPLFHNSFQ